MATATEAALSPGMAIALVGVIGVGSQWLAWRLHLPAIVVMLSAGILVGPATGLFDPYRDIGPLTPTLVSLAVAVILFEGGMTLSLNRLRDAAEGVFRLVLIGAPLGWLLSTLALRYGAGLGWEAATVFGGIMIVTGPTVIAPLLRNARLQRRPAELLRWEAILNDPLGALAAVLAFEIVLVLYTADAAGDAVGKLAMGIGVATVLGLAAGVGIGQSFKRGLVPEYMKAPVLFVVLLIAFALSDAVLHESGLLAVTIMGVYIANANLPSYDELRRFKEYATVLLVSGVFVLLAASLDFSALGQLTWRSAVFVVLVVIIARPLTVLISLVGTSLPMRERWLVALTGPRGVVLVAVAGLFGERLVALGVEDGALIGPLAFLLVAVTVVVHGFTLKPFAKALGLTGSQVPGVLIVGGSAWTRTLAEALQGAEIPVLVADPNRAHLRPLRDAGIPTFFGDILSEAAEHHVTLDHYGALIAATDNDAYNTLVATDLGPEIGRNSIFQVARETAKNARNALPATLGGRAFGQDETYLELERRAQDGWSARVTRLSEEFTLEDWRERWPEAVLLAVISPSGALSFVEDGEPGKVAAESRLIALVPPEAARKNGRVAASA